MASKTGKLVLTGAMTAALAAGCQTQPLSTGASMGLDASATGGYGLLGKKAPAAGSGQPTAGGSCLEQNYAVFARSESVNLHFTGARNTIEGDVHTNDELKMAGNNDVITGISEAVDGFFIKGNNNSAGNRVASAVEPYPLTIDPDALGPATFTFVGDVNLNDRPEVWAARGVLKPGIYRASGKIVLSTNGAKGEVTLIGSSIQLPGKQHDLTAYAGGVLGYATGAGANTIHLAGNSNSYKGLFAAPNGEFQMTGSQNEVSGMVLADTFKLAGANNTIRFADHGYCPPAATLPPSSAPGDTEPSTAPGGAEPSDAPGGPQPSPEASAGAPTTEPSGAPDESSPSHDPAPTPSVEISPSPTPTPTGTPTAVPTATPSSVPTPTPPPTMTPPPIPKG